MLTPEQMQELADMMPWAISYANGLSRNITDAEDIAMDAYLKVIKSYFDPARGAKTLQSWYAVVIEHTCIDRNRRNTSREGGPRYVQLHDDSQSGEADATFGGDPGGHSIPLEMISENPWDTVDTRMVAGVILEPFSDEEVSTLTTSSREQAHRTGKNRWHASRNKRKLTDKLRARAEGILHDEVESQYNCSAKLLSRSRKPAREGWQESHDFSRGEDVK